MATKKQKLNEMNSVELNKMLTTQREELRVLRFASAGGRPKDSTAPKKVRRQIARILTELHAQNTSAMLGTNTATA